MVKVFKWGLNVKEARKEAEEFAAKIQEQGYTVSHFWTNPSLFTFEVEYERSK
jgi:hypothetical protein